MKFTVTLLVLLLLELITVNAFPKTQCVGKEVDIMFVLDSSSSIWPIDFERLLKFLQNFVDTFEIGTNKMRMGAITYSKKAHLEFPIGQYVNKGKLQKAIANIHYKSGWTNTGAALNLAKEQFQSLAKNKTSLVTIVITDGNSRFTKRTKAEAEDLHRLGIKVYAIGIGKKYHIKELKAIASDPENGVYRIFNYKALESIGKNFFIKSCGEETKAPSNIKLKSTPAVPKNTTKSPALTVNDTTTAVSPDTTATVPVTTSTKSDATVNTPVPIIETTTNNDRNETISNDKPAEETKATSNIKLKSTPAVPKKTTNSPALTANDTTTTVSPDTTATVPVTTSTKSDATVNTPVPIIETTTNNDRNETISKDKPAKGRPERLSKNEATVILFGYDMTSMGYHRSSKISTFLTTLLPYMGYQLFAVTTYVNCPDEFGIPLTPLTNSNKLLFEMNNLPTLVDIVRKMRNLIYTYVLHQAHFGTPTAVLFVDSDLTNISDSLLEETRNLKNVGARLFVLNIGSSNFPVTQDFYFLSSQPYKYYTYNIKSYKQMVHLANTSPNIFRYMCNYDFSKKSSSMSTKRP